MSSSRPEPRSSRATSVRIARQALVVDLDDGRALTVPLAWYPRLLHGTPRERSHWRLIGGGEGIHWPDLDEDISVEGLLAGRPSSESQASFTQWVSERSSRRRRRAAHPTGAGNVADTARRQPPPRQA